MFVARAADYCLMEKYLVLICVCFGLYACVKDKPNHPVLPQVQLSHEQKVYVINEGPFQGGASGSVSLFDTGTNEVVENFYETQNQAQLGNVVQSMNYIHGHYYIVVNNANKIVVCNNQFRKTGQINDLTSPRYILPVTNQKAYVSDLYANAISIVDLNTELKTGTIPCAGKTEHMVLIYNKVFVANTDREYVYVINTLADTILDSVFVGTGAAGIVLDKYDKIWVLGSGSGSSSPGRLSRINPLDRTVEAVFNFEPGKLPGNLCLNRSKDTLYFLSDGVFRMAIASTALPSQVFIAKGERNFYGLGINPNDYSVYVSDALDYTQRSHIYIYNPDGSLKHDFKAGIISNGFYFE